METNFDYTDDVGKQNTRMMEKAFKSRNYTITKEKINQIIEDFLTKHDQKELNVAIYLNSNSRKSICKFHIDTPEYEIVENSIKSQLIISNFTMPQSLIPDNVIIQYKEVIRCGLTVRTGETTNDIVAHVLKIEFKNGTFMELGFLCI